MYSLRHTLPRLAPIKNLPASLSTILMQVYQRSRARIWVARSFGNKLFIL